MTGFLYGLGFFGFGVSWVFVSIHRYGEASLFLAILLTSLLIFSLSLYFVVLAWAFHYVNRHQSPRSIQTLFLFPSLWVCIEWLRSHLFTGFPWLLLGYSQTDTPLAGFAPLIGTYGLSWLLVFFAASLVYLGRQVLAKQYRLATWPLALASLFFLGGSQLYHHVHWTQTHPERYQLSLVQGNLSPMEKFAKQEEEGYERYHRLSQPLVDSDLIVWPENAIVHAIPFINPVLDFFDAQAKARQQTWILGIPTFQGEQYHNTLLTLGLNQQAYYKIHLLPFGDYLPFETYLRGIIQFFDLPLSAFRPGPKHQAPLQLKSWKAMPAICYEIAYSHLFKRLAADSHLLLAISEDGWFGDSLGPHQHLQIAQMRSLENEKPTVRSTSSGVSAFIGEKGQILSQAPQFQTTTLTHRLDARAGKTPWNTWGDWPSLLSSLTFLAWVAYPRTSTRTAHA